MPRTVVWKLNPVRSSTGELIESSESARQAGEAYIQKIKEEGETVLEVREEKNRLIITLE